jgi:hypothetical protein
MKKLIFLAILAAASGMAQQQFQDMIKFDQLAPKASKTVEVNLDGSMLEFVKKFMDRSKPEEAEALRILDKLKGIYVRSLEFERDGEYSEADIEALRKQFSAPGWQKVVDVREKGRHGDNAGVYMRTDGKEMSGMVVLAFEPREVTIVNVVGTIDPAELRQLGGKMGIPRMNILRDLAPDKKRRNDKDDNE